MRIKLLKFAAFGLARQGVKYAKEHPDEMQKLQKTAKEAAQKAHAKGKEAFEKASEKIKKEDNAD